MPIRSHLFDMHLERMTDKYKAEVARKKTLREE
jgi:hypothetical protein